MLKWYKLEGSFPEHDFVEQIKVNGKKLCLVRHQDQTFVVQNSCPHAGGILSGGTCKNGYLICPIHRWEYNLETGRGAEGQGDYIDTYPVETRVDGIYVGLKESWIKKLFS
ncbi:(2Fe-2S)-binding protein [Pedobacter sp. PACM 27299]|uniref:Rieske (2Fe-2S) protein n=1 Tax=Pedobacter sp. PACM 27299 TaxID=1727164 RepID=UPI00070629F8|nr:Rieske (2Fe-2S) protein [Pedobacter sp. PACM 27299]ALL05885.1 (2Fe-2S)-binding protein [Pedobacter sp. PACM 27299]